MGLFGPKGEKTTIKVSGMTCGHCVMRVEKALDGLDGVKKAKVSLKKNEAEVVYDEKLVSPKDMKKAIEKAGYQAD